MPPLPPDLCTWQTAPRRAAAALAPGHSTVRTPRAPRSARANAQGLHNVLLPQRRIGTIPQRQEYGPGASRRHHEHQQQHQTAERRAGLPWRHSSSVPRTSRPWIRRCRHSTRPFREHEGVLVPLPRVHAQLPLPPALRALPFLDFSTEALLFLAQPLLFAHPLRQRCGLPIGRQGLKPAAPLGRAPGRKLLQGRALLLEFLERSLSRKPIPGLPPLHPLLQVVGDHGAPFHAATCWPQSPGHGRGPARRRWPAVVPPGYPCAIFWRCAMTVSQRSVW